MTKKPTFTSVLANPGIRYLWFNQILVQLSFSTLNFALIIWVFRLVGSNFAVSALILSIYLPVILFGLFAGVLVDLLDRRRIIILVDILLAISFLLFVFIKNIYPLILLNAFIMNSLTQFFMPSERSSIPMFVKDRELMVANSLFSLTLYGAFLLSFSLGGPLLEHLGINRIFYLGGGLLVLAFLLAHNLPSIKVGVSNQSVDKSSLLSVRSVVFLTWKQTKEAIDYIIGRVNVSISIGLMSGVQAIVGILAVIMPSYLEKTLLIKATQGSYIIMLPLGIGMIVGALLTGRKLHSIPKRSIVVPAILGDGLLFLAGAILPAFQHVLYPTSITMILSIISFLMGFCTVLIVIPCQTVLQEHTKEQYRGRVFSILAVATTLISAIPVMLSGGLSDLFGVVPILFTIGAIITMFGLLAFRPSFFFRGNHLPFRAREFLGLEHWGEKPTKSQ
ncbi:MFS transporter [Candidatus Daviesbacteria bacterium]|nr:MFS transporter [Candidatus Daviesbacteria bacterium]